MALQAGTLYLTVEFAQNLKDKDWFGKMDPYAVVEVGGQKFRTKTKQSAGRNPVWNETFTFAVINDNTFKIAIFDEDAVSDELVGVVQGDLSAARTSGSQHAQLPVMSSHSGKQHGIVSVNLRFEAQVKAPAAQAACAPMQQQQQYQQPPTTTVIYASAPPAAAPPPAYYAPPPQPMYAAPPPQPVYAAAPYPAAYPPAPQPMYAAPPPAAYYPPPAPYYR